MHPDHAPVSSRQNPELRAPRPRRSGCPPFRSGGADVRDDFSGIGCPGSIGHALHELDTPRGEHPELDVHIAFEVAVGMLSRNNQLLSSGERVRFEARVFRGLHLRGRRDLGAPISGGHRREDGHTTQHLDSQGPDVAWIRVLPRRARSRAGRPRVLRHRQRYRAWSTESRSAVGGCSGLATSA